MDYDFLVIGAGVVGLAQAEILSRNNNRVLVIEKEGRIGTGVSSRNSEVIHAGIYYPPGSLKSRLCIRGKELLYDWCQRKSVAHSNIGKFIIAVNEEEMEKLESVKRNAAEAGMWDLHTVTKEEIKKEEPYVFSSGGLYSPTTGIISAHGLMDSLKCAAEEKGADFLFNAKLTAFSKNSSSGYIAEIKDSTGELTKIEIGGVINAAGLYSDQVAELLGVNDPAYKLKMVKGNYFRLRGRKEVFRHLIYPVPMPKLHGLGVHVTLDLNGGVRFGPDVEKEPVKEEKYFVDESRKGDFFNAIKTYFPLLQYDDLYPDMSGIRPRLAMDRDFNDFIISEELSHGLPHVVNLVGIESPGLTASMAIAEYVYGRFIS
ncbi:MAG: NAD(P)/FAD-dependent oxidoreductase [Ignavibacteria bacterium]|jgi:L-2-hydroxyglutarate oxidase LhgO|nr:NAD(P)/FAD-dependent oxidoreductase [Ignavibacteria bacterium]